MSVRTATGLAITNPLVKYRALVATKAISPDNGQLRLALHLQKLYERLKDYEPQVEYSQRLDQISRTVKNNAEQDGATSLNQDGIPPRKKQNSWRALLAAKEQRGSLALTQRLTSHESAVQLTSPRGLMLHGEVGTGKSMLVDLFADCLPNDRKRRWHFNTFMLETFAKLESLRRTRSASPSHTSPGGIADDYPLLWLAKDLIQTSPILFLDEFQMPDRAASKILTNLMTSFFHLGGVLVATSNRMPEELAKAAGIEFSPPPSRMESLGWQFGLRRRSSSRSGNELFGGQNEFAAFLEVLKARCEVWEMEGGRDYRRMESGTATPQEEFEEVGGEWRVDRHEDLQHSVGMAGWPAAQDAKTKPDLETGNESRHQEQSASVPRYYHLSSEDNLVKGAAYQAALEQATGERSSSINEGDKMNFTPSQMRVYGRKIPVPRSHLSGITDWTFDELCKTPLGPADYITLASTYHTLLLHNVPVLTSLMKNEARRFITLLDALYECRCKLFVAGAAVGPDELFFPEKKMRGDEEAGDAIQSETFSEAYQDATAPFRPNILTENPNYAELDPEPNYTHARLAGLLNADALEGRPTQQDSATEAQKSLWTLFRQDGCRDAARTHPFRRAAVSV